MSRDLIKPCFFEGDYSKGWTTCPGDSWESPSWHLWELPAWTLEHSSSMMCSFLPYSLSLDSEDHSPISEYRQGMLSVSCEHAHWWSSDATCTAKGEIHLIDRKFAMCVFHAYQYFSLEKLKGYWSFSHVLILIQNTYLRLIIIKNNQYKAIIWESGS